MQEELVFRSQIVVDTSVINVIGFVGRGVEDEALRVNAVAKTRWVVDRGGIAAADETQQGRVGANTLGI